MIFVGLVFEILMPFAAGEVDWQPKWADRGGNHNGAGQGQGGSSRGGQCRLDCAGVTGGKLHLLDEKITWVGLGHETLTDLKNTDLTRAWNALLQNDFLQTRHPTNRARHLNKLASTDKAVRLFGTAFVGSLN